MTRYACLFFALSLSACSGSAFNSNAGTGGSNPGTGGGHTGGSDHGTGGDVGVAGAVSSGGGTSVGGASSGGGAVGVGGGVSVGGSIGAGGGTTDVCQELWSDYLVKLEAARLCDPNLSSQCSLDSTLPNRCGCPVLVNPTRNAEAKAAYQTLTTNGCVQMVCGIACVVYTDVKCSASSSGSAAVCSGA